MPHRNSLLRVFYRSLRKPKESKGVVVAAVVVVVGEVKRREGVLLCDVAGLVPHVVD